MQVEYSISACAKVNLFLEVLGRRNDGYHDIVSVLQEIDLADEISACPAEPGSVTLHVDDPELPAGADNLVIRAARSLQQAAGIKEGITFALKKRIPAGGGLGGGSSDAAAALRLACRVWNLPEEMDELMRIAARMGSDIPFFLHGGTCLCEGRGERVTPLPDAGGLPLLLLVPAWRIATRHAYASLAESDFGARDPGALLRALKSMDLQGVAMAAFNRFEEAVFRLEPRQARLHRRCRGMGLRHLRLSGSGSAAWSPQVGGIDLGGLRGLDGIETVAEVMTTKKSESKKHDR